MQFEVNVLKEALTAPEVSIKLDAETCFKLSEVFTELGNALYTAQARHKARNRYEEAAPEREARYKRLRASVASLMEDFKGLPYKKLSSLIGKELGIGYDAAEIICAEIRREKRQAALSSRNEGIVRMAKEGLSAKEISERLNLSRGTVWNILARQKRASAPRAGAKARAA